jgi:hypothetical protein
MTTSVLNSTYSQAFIIASKGLQGLDFLSELVRLI